MDAKQQAHVKMLITTSDVLDANQPLWVSIVAFGTARTGLGTAITNIQNEELKQAGTTVGGTEGKRVARQFMCDASAVVGGAVAQWAETQGDPELFAKVDFSSPDLMHQAEQDCLTNCQGIYDAGTASLAAMAAGKSLAQADLDDLKEKIADFRTLLTRPRQIRSTIKGATDQLPDLITAADRILERQIDRLMERFKATSPDFYAAYQVARVIVDTGGGSSSVTPPAPAPATTTTTTTPAAPTGVKVNP
jgi:hypothetical protein